jgi:hypothetical protein
MPEAKKACAVGFNHIALELGDIEEPLAFYGREARKVGRQVTGRSTAKSVTAPASMPRRRSGKVT